MWLRDYHVDALRLDAVHALQDSSRRHILAELAERGGRAASVGRPAAHPDRRVRPQRPGHDRAPAAAATAWTRSGTTTCTTRCTRLLTGETQGYYCDFGSLAVLRRCSRARSCTTARTRRSAGGCTASGRPRAHARLAFVVRCRTTTRSATAPSATGCPSSTTPGLVRVGAVLLLTAPFTPMLWMGEEWARRRAGRSSPRTRSPSSAEVDREGPGRGVRRARLGRRPDDRSAGPGGLSQRGPATGTSRRGRPHAEVLDLYRRLIALRAAEPELHRRRPHPRVASTIDEDAALAGHAPRRAAGRREPRRPGPRTVPIEAFDLVLATGSIDVAPGA